MDLPTTEPKLEAVSSISISVPLEEGVTLKARYIDHHGKIDTKKRVLWKSNDPNIVAVDVNTGKLTARKPGTTKVTASAFTHLGENVNIEFTVIVPKPLIKPELELSDKIIISIIDSEEPISVDYSFVDQEGNPLTPSSVKWELERTNYELLKVSEDGTITPLKPGIARIKLTVSFEGKHYSKTIEIELRQEPEIRINSPNSEIPIGADSTEQLTVTFFNELGKEVEIDKDLIVWESEDQEIITIDSNGVIEPVKLGKANILVSIQVNEIVYTKSIELEVVREIEILHPNLPEQLKKGQETGQLGNDIQFINKYGEKVSPDKVCWESGDPEILTVACDGTLIPHRAGSVEISLKVEVEGEIYPKVVGSLKIVQDPEIRIINASEEIKTTDERRQLSYQYTDESGKIGYSNSVKIKWESSNRESLDINSFGILFPKKADEVVISITAFQDEKEIARDQFTFKVKQPAKIEFVNPPKQLSTVSDNKTKLQVKYTNEDGEVYTPPEISFSSEDEDILRINESGELTIISVGETKITAKVGKDGPENTIIIGVMEVIDPVLVIDQKDQTLQKGESLTISFKYTDKHGNIPDPQPTVNWKVDKNGIIDYNTNTGEVIARSAGIVNLIITSQGVMDEITLTVIVDPELVVTAPNYPIQIGRDVHDLDPIFTNELKKNRTFTQNIRYTEYDKEIITVDSKGIVTPINVGITNVNIETAYAGRKYQETVAIEVVSLNIAEIPELEVGGNDHKLEVTFIDERGKSSNPKVVWSSSLYNVSDGNLKPTRPGLSEYVRASYTYKGGLYIATTTASIRGEIAFSINYIDETVIIPQYGYGKETWGTTLTDIWGRTLSDEAYEVSWNSNDDDIAKINNLGELNPISIGTTTITATTNYEDKVYEDEVEIKIEQPILILTGGTDDGILVGDRLSFDYSFTNGSSGPSLSPSKVIWNSADERGNFVPQKVGESTVSVSVHYRGHQFDDSQTLKVLDLQITGKPPNDRTTIGEAEPDLDFEFINEENDVVTSVTARWSLKNSSNSSVLTIDSTTGLVTPIGKGEATVILTIRYEDKIFIKEYEITIKAPLIDVDLNSAQYEQSDFVWKAMNYWYLWQSQVPLLSDSEAVSENEYKQLIKDNPSATSFFNRLLHRNDKYSRAISGNEAIALTTDGSLDHGMEFIILTSSSATRNNVLGLVLYTSPGSNADGKVSRGDYFSHVNGQRLTSYNWRSLMGSSTLSLKMVDLIRNTDPTNNSAKPFREIDLGTTITINKEQHTRNPILVSQIVSIGSHKIGYIAYDSFTSSSDGLNSVFKFFKDSNITDLVVDLRYNLGGRTSTAINLGSMISGLGTNEIFMIQSYNSKVSGGNRIGRTFRDYLDINRTKPIHKVNVSRVFVLTGRWTYSASELIINCLRPYMQVIQIGGKTGGKNVGSVLLFDHNDYPQNYYKEQGSRNTDHNLHLAPIVSRLANSQGFSAYENGFRANNGNHPDGEGTLDLRPLGDPSELLFSRAIELITGQTRRRAIDDISTHPRVISPQPEGLMIDFLDDFPSEIQNN